MVDTGKFELLDTLLQSHSEPSYFHRILQVDVPFKAQVPSTKRVSSSKRKLPLLLTPASSCDAR